MNKFEERVKRTKWLMHDRFGMFIHWGIYAIPARGEWIRSRETLSIEDYQTYFEEFDPKDYNPKEWAKLAKRAGMKYAVITTKHHDGFCLFDSKLTDYKATNTPAGRDLIKEFVEAFTEEGLKIGFYYSLLDWYHEDYPKYGDKHHPMRHNEKYKNEAKNFENYIDYFHGQVKELLTNYGKIDIIWFDFSYENEKYNMSGEKWQATKLVKMIRDIQPDIIIDNRLELNIHDSDDLNIFNRFTSGEINDYTGDFMSPEQIIPIGGVTDSKGQLIPWEACITLNKNWGYNAADKDYKTPNQVIRALVECVSKGGNLLLNVGPDAKGNIPKESVEILNEVGKWMDKNSDSIYGCTKAGIEKPEWGRYTQNEKKLHAHIYDRGIGPINLAGLRKKVEIARLLMDGSEVELTTPWNAEKNKRDAFIESLSQKLPDENDTVVQLNLKEL